MKFCEYLPDLHFSVDMIQQLAPSGDYSGQAPRVANVSGRDNKLAVIQDIFLRSSVLDHAPYSFGSQCCIEWEWLRQGRPYYKVHPSLIPAIESTKLDVTWQQAGFGVVDPISIEFESKQTDDFYLRSLLVAVVDIRNPGPAKAMYSRLLNRRGISLCANEAQWIGRTDHMGLELVVILDYNERSTDLKSITKDFDLAHSFLCVPLYRDMTLEERIESSAYLNPEVLANGHDLRKPIATVKNVDEQQQKFTYLAMRAVMMVLALRDNPDFITPEVLAKDQQKFDKTKDKKYVEKAKRLGKYGFLVGFNSQGVVPHLRRWHMAWRWFGAGKTQKRLVPIKPTIVRRDKLAEVPQGWHDELAKGENND